MAFYEIGKVYKYLVRGKAHKLIRFDPCSGCEFTEAAHCPGYLVFAGDDSYGHCGFGGTKPNSTLVDISPDELYKLSNSLNDFPMQKEEPK